MTHNSSCLRPGISLGTEKVDDIQTTAGAEVTNQSQFRESLDNTQTKRPRSKTNAHN
ncbi:hypothetical protein BaRGS_00009115, partial [Batillaria attramentaria]